MQSQFLSFAVSLSAMVAVVAAAASGQMEDPGRVAVALAYSFMVPYFMSMMAHIVAAISMNFTSLERVLEYASLPQEAARTLPQDPDPAAWPEEGAIELRGASMRYRPGLPLALKGVSVRIH